VPILLLLNGPPGIGKSTLARRYVENHPLAFCLDIDELRRRVGQWEVHEQESGLLARRMAIEMARTHLSAGHDVVVPQFLGRVHFIEQLEAMAVLVGARFVEVVLMDSNTQALSRFAARGKDPRTSAHHREAARTAGGTAGLTEMWERLQDVVAQRPRATVVQTLAGDVDGAYAALLVAVGQPARD